MKAILIAIAIDLMVVGCGGAAPYMGLATTGGFNAHSPIANSGAGGTSGNFAGATGYCRVTEYYSM